MRFMCRQMLTIDTVALWPSLLALIPNAGFAWDSSNRFVQKKRSGEKNDIQSWVLNGPFSVNFRNRNGREIAIRPTKKRAD